MTGTIAMDMTDAEKDTVPAGPPEPRRAGPGKTTFFPPVPADPALREEIEALARDLARGDFVRRERAEKRFLAIGPPAAWALARIATRAIPGAQERAWRILVAWGWPADILVAAEETSPVILRRVEELVQPIRRGCRREEATARLAALERLGSFGERLSRFLRAPRQADPAEAALSARPSRRVWRRGEAMALTATIKNVGTEYLWIDTGRFTLAKTDWTSPDGFQPVQAPSPALPMTEIETVLLAPGDAAEMPLALAGAAVDGVGCFRLTLGYRALPPQRISEPPCTSLKIGKTLPETHLLLPSAMVPLPDDPIALGLEAVEASANGSLRVDLAVETRTRATISVPVAPNGTLGRGYWAALLGEGDEPVYWTLFGHGYAEDTPLAPGASLRLTGRIIEDGWREHLPPGAYRLVVGLHRAVPLEAALADFSAFSGDVVSAAARVCL